MPTWTDCECPHCGHRDKYTEPLENVEEPGTRQCPDCEQEYEICGRIIVVWSTEEIRDAR